ncbi:restriction endonuclease subunit S [Phocaeicola vulgatus]|jgi:type I restriction enzyme S subunit|uniref:restriction endonuclease subunit S n=1 Tax=Phocaeicola vulgatus TaxID=821 RepID=UPI0022E3593C|nr:restriction endonuclease subunit S [Phocaeicola vulgatus]
MNGKQLKNSILQWAIQGKLVPQDPNDEPASVLLERIRAEKARLVKEKKIKKDKNESIIYRGDDNSYYEKFLTTGEVKCIDEEIPFEIPKGWEWARINAIGVSQLGKTLDRGKESGKEYPYLCSINVYWDSINLSKIKTFRLRDDELPKYKLRKGDLLICEGGDYGRCCIWDRNEDMYYQNALHRVRFHGGLIPSFYKYVFELYRNIGYIVGQGQTIKHFTYENMRSILFPVPSIHEQKRIVSRIEEIQPIVKKYQRTEDALKRLNTEIFDKLKKSILQEAIQGKLVSQITEEGTAQELLKQIKTEKEKLVKKGKLKKSALTDSVIYKGDDNKYYERINGQIVEVELPFEYPNSWAVLRLKDICQLIDGEKRNGKGICLDAKYLRGKSSATIVEKGKFVYARDNIILVDGENSGEVFTVPQDGYMGSTFKQLWLSSAMWKPYILAFILFYKEELRNSKRGAAIPHLNKELFYNLPIGIPPLAEQQRISERINELSQLLK